MHHDAAAPWCIFFVEALVQRIIRQAMNYYLERLEDRHGMYVHTVNPLLRSLSILGRYA
jgi:hypothetical protein